MTTKLMQSNFTPLYMRNQQLNKANGGQIKWTIHVCTSLNVNTANAVKIVDVTKGQT